MRALFALLVVLGGCARAPRVRPVPTVPPPPAGYDRRVDDPVLAEGASLAGRRIVLDPGHGGFFRGALGLKGLTEAEVNLGVALQLRDRLVAAGAQVLLTRANDRDFLSPADSALRTDLNTRVAMSEAFAPDAFVSIHHNADAGGRHDVNETITFYRLGDDGPSLELAQDVHRALVRHVGIRPQRVTPGNFAVLRGSTAPAILTETSYITYPPTEALLRQPDKQQIEAEALFVGLANYFARPVPVVEEFVAAAPGESVTAGSTGALGTFGDPVFRGRIRGAFDQVRIRLDGRDLRVARTGSEVWAIADPPVASGDHVVTLTAALAGQGTTLPSRIRFRMRICDNQTRSAVWNEMAWSGLLPIRIQAVDHRGRSSTDSSVSSTVSVRARPAGALSPSETTLVLRDGVAWFYPRPNPSSVPRGRRGLSVALRIETDRLCEGDGGYPETLYASVTRETGRGRWSGFVLDMPSAAPLRDAPGTMEPIREDAWMNRDGFAVVALDSSGAARIPRLPGYRTWASDSLLPPRFTAIAGGALHRKRITLDPDGGGESSGGAGPGGTRGSDLNLAVARALRGMLEAAGADVLLTRDGDYAVSEVERVQRSETFRADRFVRIGHKAEVPRIGHYFSSAGGRKWAQRTGEVLAALGLPAPPAAEDSQYPIQQTSCPALYAGFARVDSAAEESRLLAPGTLRAEAYALFVSIAREWTDRADWTLDSLDVRGGHGEPVDAAPVTLGGTLVLETDTFGRARFFRTEPGPIEIAVDDPRVRARVVLIDSARAPTLTGPPRR